MSLKLSTFNTADASVPVEVTGVRAYFVADNNVVASNEPYTGVPGSRSTLVNDGTAVPLALDETTVTGEYDATLNVPSPTWSWSTDGTLNGYGWSGRIVTVAEGVANGVPVTQVESIGLNVYSAHLYDIRNFHIDPPLNEGEVGVSGSSYFITGETVIIGQPPIVNPPVITPPAVDPPVVVPPSVTPPVAPEPEPTPVGPRVESGADSSQQLVWFPLALSAGILLGLFPVLFAVRRRERAEQ